jgi:hypothetical protein
MRDDSRHVDPPAEPRHDDPHLETRRVAAPPAYDPGYGATNVNVGETPAGSATGDATAFGGGPSGPAW